MKTDDVFVLRSGPLVLNVAPAACGAITRFAHEDDERVVELLRPANPDAIAARDPLGMSCFPLVPFSNRIRNGTFVFEGREVRLAANFPPEPHAIHGHGWRAAWVVTAHDPQRLTIAYEHPAADWPFAYTATQRYELSESGLTVTFTVANRSDDPMPAGFGLHPYFVRTPQSRLTSSVERMWTADANAMPDELIPVPRQVDLERGLNPNDVALDNNFMGFGGDALIEWPEHRSSLRLATEGPFTCLVVFTPAGEPFFCAEPVTNCIDAFNLLAAGRTDTGTIVIPPGEQASGRVRFEPRVEPRREGAR